ncbi:MAG: FkbM family methyltransferase [Gammaproteobacteria bacterium]|nr:FkbM family methyltransferase [Gammaproteobacteria bacterium]
MRQAIRSIAGTGVVNQYRILRTWLLQFYRVVTAIGLIAALRLRYRKASTDFKIRPKGVTKPFLIRGNSSDTNVFVQIFITEEYACLNDMANNGLIIDAGANVGYSSIYFLSRFPYCQIIAIEPDPENFAILKRNLSPYADRVELHNAGIWSHPAQLVLQSAPYRDGREWTRQVRECENDEAAEMNAIDVEEILKASGHDRVSLLKMDIEGAEAVVFAAGAYDQWLDKIDAIAIELHDDSTFGNATDIFYSAIQGQGFSVSRSGELTICRRNGVTNA